VACGVLRRQLPCREPDEAAGSGRCTGVIGGNASALATAAASSSGPGWQRAIPAALSCVWPGVANRVPPSWPTSPGRSQVHHPSRDV